MPEETKKPETALAKKPETTVEYAAFGSNETVKLNASIIRNFIAAPTKSGAQASDKECMKFMALCKARALNPFEGDAFLLGYDGKDGPQFSLITAHQAFLKRAEAAPEFDGMESGIVVRDESKAIVERVGDLRYEGETLLGGWATVYFKNKSRPMKKILDVRKFAKPYGVWQSNPEGMIAKCAEADALRSSFPNKLGGCYLREEMDATPVTATVSAPKRAQIAAPVQMDAAPETTPAETQTPPDAPDAQERADLIARLLEIQKATPLKIKRALAAADVQAESIATDLTTEQLKSIEAELQ